MSRSRLCWDCYRRKKWTRRVGFKSWSRLFVFYFAVQYLDHNSFSFTWPTLYLVIEKNREENSKSYGFPTPEQHEGCNSSAKNISSAVDIRNVSAKSIHSYRFWRKLQEGFFYERSRLKKKCVKEAKACKEILLIQGKQQHLFWKRHSTFF